MHLYLIPILIPVIVYFIHLLHILIFFPLSLVGMTNFLFFTHDFILNTLIVVIHIFKYVFYILCLYHM